MFDEMRHRLVAAWASVPAHAIQSLIDSMPRRTRDTSRTAENIEKVSAALRKNILQTIAELVGIALATCQWMLTKDLHMIRVCQHIVPRMLNEGQSADEVKSASQAELKDMAKNGFQKCFEDLYKPWQKCVVTQRSYFKEQLFFV
ncbi:hypothetical protein TNCV_3124611 [Trichonephila clavipes]|nr:hypothetical protein TNCV_3124611 [Trichonephila clavipes]